MFSYMLKKTIFYLNKNYLYLHRLKSFFRRKRYSYTIEKNFFQPKEKVSYTYPEIINFAKKKKFPNPLKKPIFNPTKKFSSLSKINQFLKRKTWKSWFSLQKICYTYQNKINCLSKNNSKLSEKSRFSTPQKISYIYIFTQESIIKKKNKIHTH